MDPFQYEIFIDLDFPLLSCVNEYDFSDKFLGFMDVFLYEISRGFVDVDTRDYG